MYSYKEVLGIVYPATHMILLGLPLPSFSLITAWSHTPSNSLFSDSKEHPSYRHNASVWEGSERCIICNMGNMQKNTTYNVYMEDESASAPVQQEQVIENASDC